MPFALPGQLMPNHPGRKARRLRGSWGLGAYIPPVVGSWILSTGLWRDIGVWDDASNWID